MQQFRYHAPWDPSLPVAALVAVYGWLHVGQGGVIDLADVPDPLVFVWTLTFALGGTTAVVGSLLHRTRIESVGMVFSATGLVLYAAAAGLLTGDRTGVIIAVSLTAVCLLRLRVLSLAREAEAKAARIQQRRKRWRR